MMNFNQILIFFQIEDCVNDLDFKPGGLDYFIYDNCFAAIKINNLIFTYGGFVLIFQRV